MKRHILKITGALIIALAGTSCLDLDPKDQLSDAQVWVKAANYTQFANQFYNWTRDFRGSTSVTYMNGVSDGPHADTRSDLLCEASENAWSAGRNSIPATDANYNTLYKRIYYTNLLLKNSASFPSQTEIAEPMGEAYFFRAYLHFELVQLYGDCILVQKALDISSGELYGKRNDRLDVIKACIDDLEKAAELLKESPSEDGRVGKYAALAMLSRVALYEGSWQKYHNGENEEAKALFTKAAEAAKEVMNSKMYSLFSNDKLGGRDSYRYMFLLENVDCNPAKLTKGDNTEYIFTRRHDEALKPIGLNITHAMGSAFYPTSKLADMYRCQDGLPISISPLFKGYEKENSEFDNRDNRMNATLLKQGQKYWTNDGKSRTTWDAGDEGNDEKGEKRYMEGGRTGNSGYPVYKWATERKVTDALEGYDYPVIRYAEVLLNYAEATYEINEQISDTDLDISLNLVRKRSNPDMAKLSNKLVTDHSGDMTMLGEIRAERTVELFMEGFRIDDLKRWKSAEVEMPGDLLGLQYKGTWYESGWTDQKRMLNADGRIIMYTDRSWDKKHYLLPLPSDERQLNPELGQNPGWN